MRAPIKCSGRVDEKAAFRKGGIPGGNRCKHVMT